MEQAAGPSAKKRSSALIAEHHAQQVSYGITPGTARQQGQIAAAHSAVGNGQQSIAAIHRRRAVAWRQAGRFWVQHRDLVARNNTTVYHSYPASQQVGSAG